MKGREKCCLGVGVHLAYVRSSTTNTAAYNVQQCLLVLISEKVAISNSPLLSELLFFGYVSHVEVGVNGAITEGNHHSVAWDAVVAGA